MAGTVRREVHAPLAIINVQQFCERKTVLFCREWSSREATWREARSSQSAILFLFFLWALKEKLVVVLKKKYFKNFTNDTKYDIMMSPRMQSCGFGQSNHVSRINRVIWLVAVVRLKEKEGKNEQHGCMTVLWRRFLLRSKLVFTVCFWGVQAYEGIRYVCLLACWSFWWHRSLHFSPSRRNWRRFVIRFFVRCSIIAGSYCS